jgi:UDP-glucose 4-epimerase
MNKILVTGGAGFIGSHICDKLIWEGREVHVYDSGRAGVDNVPKGAAGRKTGDLLAFKGGKYDCIVHCAARADVADNWKNQAERDRMIDANVLGTANLLEKTLGTPVVFLSTCAVYGDNENCNENAACIATSPYAASKLAGEALIQAYAFAKGLPWHVFRLGCVVGSRYHHGHIRDFVDAANNRRDGGLIHPMNDGMTKKSFVHVADVAQAVSMAIAGKLEPGVYNCASGSWGPRDTIHTMGADSYTLWPENKTHGWIGDPMAIANGSKLKAAGWLPTHGIENGVREALTTLGWVK